jgi:hypothetical protein
VFLQDGMSSAWRLGVVAGQTLSVPGTERLALWAITSFAACHACRHESGINLRHPLGCPPASPGACCDEFSSAEAGIQTSDMVISTQVGNLTTKRYDVM